MSEYGSHLGRLRDPLLAAHALSATPVWVWSADASRILWANPVGAAIFEAPSPAAIAGFTIDPKGSAALQIARLAGSLTQGSGPRLERLRGFGGRLGGALVCACSRVVLADGSPALLVAATEAAGPERSLTDRARRLLDGIAEPAVIFGMDGRLLHATAAAEAQFGPLPKLWAAGVDAMVRRDPTEAGTPTEIAGRAASLHRFGRDAVMLLEALAPAEPVAADPDPAHRDEPEAAQPASDRRNAKPPLRFVWQMETDGRFTLESGDFVALIDPAAAALLGRPWTEIAETLGLDADGHVAAAFETGQTWSGLTVLFPMSDHNMRLPVELSGLPVFDRERNFGGYRGFGICRDAVRAAAVQAIRTTPPSTPEPEPEQKPTPPTAEPAPPVAHEPPVLSFDEPRPALTVVPPSKNVVPFRGGAEKTPSLTAVEHKTFGELASKLAARLRNAGDETEDPLFADEAESPSATAATIPEEAAPDASQEPSMPADGQRPLLDRLPVGVLVYRLDQLLYANRAFLDWTGYPQLDHLADAGGLDALFVESPVDTLDHNGARPLAITTQGGETLPVEARLFSTPWDGDSALVLMMANPSVARSSEAALQRATAEAREWRAVLDIAGDGIVMLDRDGRIVSLNPRAETLIGARSHALEGLPFATLFGADSQGLARDQLARAGDGEISGASREVTLDVQGRTANVMMSIGPIGDDKRCAVLRAPFHDRESEQSLVEAKQQAEKASAAKSDFLAKISHEIRTPLNAIIGFSEMMMEERFGAVGNERYKHYLKDIHSSGEHLVSLLNDLLDLSKIEAGKLDLNFARVDLNALTRQCVESMQPQANRERIIIRTSLAPDVESVVADMRSIRQIMLNLLSNSIKFTAAGGQVIVSTAFNDSGEVVVRVRDTGVGMSESDLAVALEPFRQLATSTRYGSGGTGLGLPLTKALAEANRATLKIKSAVNVGTLVEVAFPNARLAAE